MDNTVKKYLDFVNESEEISNKDTSSYDNLKDDVKEKIENTIEKNGGEFKSFIDKFKQNPEDVKIEGLINDDQLYDFWLKYENEIDEILNQVNFFDKSPKDLKIIGVYKYIMVSVQLAIEEIVKML